jgi:hypothetical protein
MRLSNEILNAVARAEDLLVTLQTWPMELDGALDSERQKKVQDSFEKALGDLAHSMDNGAGGGPEPLSSLEVVSPSTLHAAPYCVATAIDKLQELQMACEGVLRLN